MSTSYFDSLIESTSAIADAVFGKQFEFCWRGQTCTLTAVLSAYSISIDADRDTAESVYRHNFEITAADLVFGGQVTQPKPGMEIRETLADGSVNMYEVRPGRGKRAFDPLDAEETRLLVYANYVQNERG